ncbi:MAG: hypothetical protein GY873_27450 [Bosea sp.]|uniref:hypothetical protein n=1 Tax=Bosea sp. (in: a-proteobacteria) TaxID=1871050 RepID=UPI002392DB43|nr:hypothetical protein [Bosea sp. (in: a-proteobacteria)]MCP4737932.1 hypothetical protein [Bosea sp. (in: a-proteobacteria)]
MSTLDRPNPTPAGVMRQADFFNDIDPLWAGADIDDQKQNANPRRLSERRGRSDQPSLL